MEKFPAIYHTNYKLIKQHEISNQAETQVCPISELNPLSLLLRLMPGITSASPCGYFKNLLIGIYHPSLASFLSCCSITHQQLLYSINIYFSKELKKKALLWIACSFLEHNYTCSGKYTAGCIFQVTNTQLFEFEGRLFQHTYALIFSFTYYYYHHHRKNTFLQMYLLNANQLKLRSMCLDSV